MTKEIHDYYMGLDIGTNSLGWAVTDENYNILEYRRKATWGIHLFEEGKKADERRMARCARRRLVRRKQRITLLRELFSGEICKVDPNFFERMDESGLHLQDRKMEQMNSLFFDEGFTDKEYHEKYPTIYHLRRDLMETEEKPDIRLVYLACHHIIKYRGHFLHGEMDDSVPKFSEVADSLEGDMRSLFGDFCFLNIDEMKSTLTDRSMKARDMESKLKELIGCDENKNVRDNVAKLLAGNKVDLAKLFDDEDLTESIKLSDGGVADALATLEDSLNPDYFQILRKAKDVYDWAVLSSMLSGFKSLSYAKIAQYEEHRSDLATLKKAIRDYAPSEYKKMFKSKEIKGNYCSYTGTCGKGKPDKSCTQEEFCKYCNSILKDVAKDRPELQEMMGKIADNAFLPLLRSTDNSLFSYSIHRSELKKILENASRFYPFLSETDQDGLSPMEKVLLIQKFRIPYYVGPIGKGAANTWSVRKSDERVTPWNMDKVVDLDASAEGFIDNLTNFCTYMVGEKVLPKNSLLYSYFQVLNEINNIRIDGDKPPVEIKKRLVKDLFKDKGGKVTKKSIVKYLKQIGAVENKADPTIEGIDDTVKSNLNSERKLREIIGDKVDNRRMAEGIIHTITVFGEPHRIRHKLTKDYSDSLTEEEIKKLSKLTFTGWGRLSEKLLTGLYATCRETGQNTNIIGMMESTNDNFNEIYHKYEFIKQVEVHNKELTSEGELTYESLDKMWMSPAVKRGVWRTVSVVRDVVGCIGHPPKKLFVETTRDVSGANGHERTVSRKGKLVQLYEAQKEDAQWLEDVKNRDEAHFKSRSIYLYYTQKGKCMYCGHNLEIDKINDSSVIDRDHIYPQSLIKDDSIHNNMVLTCKQCNQNKTNRYPIDPSIQQKMAPLWRELRDKGYITTEKYSRLTRTTGFKDDELERFINRQLVETSQSVKATIEVMKRLYKDTDVVFVRGNLVSEFRQNYNFVKCRNVNDYHHAKDAYLNIVVGNVHDVKFTKNPRKAVIERNEHYNVSKMYENTVVRDGVTAWVPCDKGTDVGGTIDTVRKYMRRDNILFTKHSLIESGELFNSQPKRNMNSLVNRKKNLPADRYGGYNSKKGACFSLVEYTDKKGKIMRSIEVLHILDIGLLGDEQALEKHYSDRIGYSVKVIIPLIRTKSLFEVNGFRMHIVEGDEKRVGFIPAVQLLLSDKEYAYCKELYKYNDDKKSKQQLKSEFYGFTPDANVSLFNTFVDKCDSKIYQGTMSTLKSNLIKIKSKFENLDTIGQADILVQILQAYHCNSTYANLKAIDGSGEAGRMRVSNVIKNGTKTYLVNQSPSGLIENKVRIDLG